MRDKRIIESWNKVGPDKAAEARVLESVMARVQAGQPEKDTAFWKRLAPVAACFVFVVALAGVFGSSAGWFGSKVQTLDLGHSTLSFQKSDFWSAGSLSLGFDVTDRALTPDEMGAMFGELPVAAKASFNAKTGAFVRLEGKSGKTTIIVAAPGTPITDTVVQGNKKTSKIKGVPVTAGYFVTDPNSKGAKNIVYFATFNLGDATMYVELGGRESDGETLRAEIGAVVEQLIGHGAPDLGRITDH